MEEGSPEAAEAELPVEVCVLQAVDMPAVVVGKVYTANESN